MVRIEARIASTCRMTVMIAIGNDCAVSPIDDPKRVGFFIITALITGVTNINIPSCCGLKEEIIQKVRFQITKPERANRTNFNLICLKGYFILEKRVIANKLVILLGARMMV